MPKRFDRAIADLRGADMTPSQRLEALAKEVTRMADEMKATVARLTAEEQHDHP